MEQANLETNSLRNLFNNKHVAERMSEKLTSYPGIRLSKRQSQCLYHVLRGKSAVAIAKILGLSPKTVEYYIDEIKNKMRCQNKSELIEKSVERGYINVNPFTK